MMPDNTTPPRQDQEPKVDKTLEFLDDAMDKMLARGDDDFYESFKTKRTPEHDQHKAQHKQRKRGKRM